MKSIKQYLFKTTLSLMFSGCILLVTAKESQMPFQANWESLSKYQSPDWFRDAKFGIFIHCGVYSVPAFNS